MIAVLTEHRQRSEARAAALGISLPDNAFVFSLVPDGSKLMKPDTLTQRYGLLAERLGIATTVHKLRHFSAAKLIAAGVDPRTVGGRLRHAGGGSTTLEASRDRRTVFSKSHSKQSRTRDQLMKR